MGGLIVRRVWSAQVAEWTKNDEKLCRAVDQRSVDEVRAMVKKVNPSTVNSNTGTTASASYNRDRHILYRIIQHKITCLVDTVLWM